MTYENDVKRKHSTTKKRSENKSRLQSTNAFEESYCEWFGYSRPSSLLFWKGYTDTGTFSRLAVNIDMTVLKFDQGFCNRKTKTVAILVFIAVTICLVKAVKNVGQTFLGLSLRHSIFDDDA